MITDRQQAAAERRMRRIQAMHDEVDAYLAKQGHSTAFSERARESRDIGESIDPLERFILCAEFDVRDKGVPFAIETDDGRWLVDEDLLFKYCWDAHVTVESVIAKATTQFAAQVEQVPGGYLVKYPSQEKTAA